MNKKVWLILNLSAWLILSIGLLLSGMGMHAGEWYKIVFMCIGLVIVIICLKSFTKIQELLNEEIDSKKTSYSESKLE